MVRISQDTDTELARKNLLFGQIRTWDVHDPGVLAAIAQLPREEFLDPQWQQLALADCSLPTAHGECTLSPRIEARILQETAPAGGEKALLVGTGCGYLCALMALAADHVDSFEWHADLSEAAKAKFSRHGIDNIDCITGNGLEDAADGGMWDVVVLSGAVRDEADFSKLKSRLAPGGRLFAITGTSMLQQASMFIRESGVIRQKRQLFPCRLPMLHGLAKRDNFVF